MTERLKDKVALISGAAQGLGKEMAKSMIAEGAEVYISDINKEQLNETAKELSCSFILHDVTNLEDWQKVIEHIFADLGSVQIKEQFGGIRSWTVTKEAA